VDIDPGIGLADNGADGDGENGQEVVQPRAFEARVLKNLEMG
jgi:hypothetical protein